MEEFAAFPIKIESVKLKLYHYCNEEIANHKSTYKIYGFQKESPIMEKVKELGERGLGKEESEIILRKIDASWVR